MYTRLKSSVSSATTFVKRAVIVVINAVPGIALVAARAGSGVFNASKFSDYLVRLLSVPELSSKSIFGITLASVGLIGAGVTNTYTRFFNAYRRESSAKKTLPPVKKDKVKAATQAKLLDDHFIPSDSVDLENQTDFAEEKEAKATFCHPGINTGSWNIGYRTSQVINVVYGFGSGSSGILSMNALIGLLQLWMKFEYEGKCGENQSETYKIILANLATALMIYANLLSFAKYNIPVLRLYVLQLFILTRLFTEDGELFQNTCKLYDENGEELSLAANEEGHLIDSNGDRVLKHSGKIFTADKKQLILLNGWDQISNWDRAGVAMGAALGTLGIWFANQNLITVFDQKMLCHVIPNVTISDGVAKTISAIGSTANFLTSGMLTLGAVATKQERERVAEAKEATENQTTEVEQNTKSELGCMATPALWCARENALNIAMGSFVAFTSLPETLANRHDLTTHPGFIVGGAFVAIISAKYQYAIDLAGLTIEEQARAKLRSAQQSAEASSTAVIILSTEPTTTNPIAIPINEYGEEEKAENRFDYPRSLSVAPIGSINTTHDPKIFGTSLPRQVRRDTIDPDLGADGIVFIPGKTLSLRTRSVTTT